MNKGLDGGKRWQKKKKKSLGKTNKLGRSREKEKNCRASPLLLLLLLLSLLLHSDVSTFHSMNFLFKRKFHDPLTAAPEKWTFISHGGVSLVLLHFLRIPSPSKSKPICMGLALPNVKPRGSWMKVLTTVVSHSRFFLSYLLLFPPPSPNVNNVSFHLFMFDLLRKINLVLGR